MGNDGLSHLTLLYVLGACCAALFSVLVALLGFGGSKIISKLDQLYDKLDKAVGDLHTRINDLNTRLTAVEAVCRTRISSSILRRREEDDQ